MKTIIAFLLMPLILITSCKKDEKDAATSTQLQVSSIWPNSGIAKTIVTINGKNFSTKTTDNVVLFNGEEAIVIEASARQLQVVAPAAGSTGKLSISVNNQSVEGPIFTYTLPPTSEYVVSTIAGNGTAGLVNGQSLSARFSSPEGVAIDANGNLIIADRQNSVIRKITPAGVVSTLAGDGVAGYVDGPAATARFNLPWKVAVDGQGNVIVADRDNFKIRKISPDGFVSTVAGSTAGYADGPAASAKFFQPLDVAVDASGNIIVADNTGHRIRKITPSGVVSTLAGNGTAGYVDGTGTAARFRNPSGLTVDKDGNIYVADRINHRIRKVSPEGVVTTLAGSGTPGLEEGDALTAKFNNPYGVAVDLQGNVFVAELTNARIRMITPAGVVSTLAGSSAGFSDGLSSDAKFNQPTDLEVDADGNIYVAETTNHRIRRIKLIK